MTEDHILSALDATQVSLLAEPCIVVDECDGSIGMATKKNCHLLENINKGMLHRAFSVFLFDSSGRLLIQQRSTSKITYPEHFTNTCCSHPLYVEGEREEREGVGVRRAAQRRLEYELGIPQHQVPLCDLHYITRIHYKADNIPHDGVFGEHEIDYVLIGQKDVDITANENEVMSHRYVTPDELRHLIENSQTDGTLLTPWFKLIAERFLYKWWDNLHDLEQFKDYTTIHRML